MNDDQIIIEVAKLDGFNPVKVSCGDWVQYRWDGYSSDGDFLRIGQYLTSRDAIVPVIEKQFREPRLRLNELKKFIRVLNELTNNEGSQSVSFFDRRNEFDIWRIVIATPRQLCEALLKACGKWKDE